MPLATIASALVPLALLACPIGMGVMMWMMARGNRQQAEPVAKHAHPASLEVLREEHDRLSAEIARLESREGRSAESPS